MNEYVIPHDEKRAIRREWINFYLQNTKWGLAALIFAVRVAEKNVYGESMNWSQYE